MKNKIDDLCEKVIGCAFKVHNTLGQGYLEKIYENALSIELNKLGFTVKQQYPIPVYYEDNLIGDYYADVLINDELILEIKAIEKLHTIHETQLVNYLTATKLDVGLLINFGKSVEVKRKYRVYKKTSQD